MQFRFRIRTMQVAVGMVAIAMVALRMSVPEHRTFVSVIPLFCFAGIGVWTARMRGWSVIVGGVVGGLLGAVSNVTMQYCYYQYFHYDPFARVIYLGPGFCFIIRAVAGSVAGSVLGLIAWVDSWL
ncbi:MAG: hypothetical protein ACLQIB_51570 [Isosphaeraceae bacterium]